ncbi:MAG: hypothetical protein AABO58_11870 [Acidobacteriota bacterium]
MKRLCLVSLLFLAWSASAHAQLTAPAPQVLVPAAGSVAGLNGTFFRSDIAVFNYRHSDQNVAFQWLPQGQSGLAETITQITIPGLSGIISEDFVNNNLHRSGLGAMVVTAVGQDGQPDPLGALFVTSRIWTLQAGNSQGTVSQTFPTIDTSRINSSNVAILGQRVSSQYRANVGIVNLSTSEQTFEVLQNSDDPTFAPLLQTVIVPPRAVQQVTLQNTRVAALQVRVRAITAVDPRQWVTYGSSIDNVTGDSWSSLGVITVVTP